MHMTRVSLLMATAAVLASRIAWAGPTDVIQLSGFLANKGGGVDGVYGFTVRFYAGDVGGPALHTDIAPAVSVTDGVFHVEVGAVQPLPPSVFTEGQAAWVGLSVDAEPELPRVRLTRVPYAYRSDMAAGLSCLGCVGAGHLEAGLLAGLATKAELGGYAKSADLAALATKAELDAYAKSADLATLATKAELGACAKSADLAQLAAKTDLAKVAFSGLYGDLTGSPALAAVATSGKYSDIQGPPALSAVASSGKFADLSGVPALVPAGTACQQGAVVAGTSADGALQCVPGYDPAKQLFQFTVSDDAPKACTKELFGSAFASAKDLAVYVCNGTGWHAISVSPYGTQASPGASCLDILTKAPGSKDGLYWISVGGAALQTYCDMTTDGGGWTLTSYGWRSQTGGSDVYYLPNAPQGTWDPGGRAGKAALDATKLLQTSTRVALTVTNGSGPAVNGNLLSYGLAYWWPKASGYTLFGLDLSTTACVTVSVTELKANKTFNALTFENRPQVSCSGHKGGTAYERQLIGFNASTCYGACGSDPVSSNGMVVWYGDGYDPTTSGGLGDPERAGSFAFWIR